MEEITFETHDKLGRKDFAERLTTAIASFSPFYDSAYVLSLNASYGSGKTTFLRMWKHYLIAQGYTVIYLNAWESDFDEDPIVPIVSNLLENIPTKKGGKKAKEALNTALGITALLGNHAFEKVTGINVKEICEASEEAKEVGDLPTIGKRVYAAYSYKLESYRKLQAALEEYAATLEKGPMILLVDELDRVRPSYAVKFLEAIKHIFSVKGLCFVIAVDRKQLKESVKQLYGNVDFENYYRRFITREAQLKESGKVELKGLINQFASEFFDEKSQQGLQFCLDTRRRSAILEFMVSLSESFKLTPREIHCVFRVFAQFFAVSNDERTARETWVNATLLLLVLSLKNPDLYHSVGSGTLESKILTDYIDQQYFPSPSSSGKRKLIMTALAFNLSRAQDNAEKSVDVFMTYDGLSTLAEGQRADILSTLKRIIDDFGSMPDDATFSFIYGRLEEWKPFLD